MKTLLRTLPDPYKDEAINNYDHKFYLKHKGKEEPITNIRKALACAFDWDESEEGYVYWYSLYMSLIKPLTNV